LRAVPLEGRTLADALESLAQEYAARGQLALKFNAGESRPLPPRIETSLYRIAQEALTNVLRHAEAHNLHLELATLPDRVEMTIWDDGRGFDPSHEPEGRYGLIGMNERARLLGGTLTMCSDPGEGTRLEVVVPLKGSA
jgi:signal transduction histidine kinase